MTWFKVDDKFHSHPKVLKAGLEAMGMWVLAGSYCANYATDGVITHDVLARIAGRRWRKLATKLVVCGLFTETLVDFRFHDWLEYNPSKVEVVSSKSELSEKRSAAGKAGNERRWGSQTHRKSVANASQTDIAIAIDSASPRPVPSRPVPGEREDILRVQPPAASPKPKAPRKPPTATAGYQTIIDAYWTRFERQFGRKPVFSEGTGKAAKAMAAMPLADAIGCIDNAFQDPWFVENKPDLGHIARNANKYLPKVMAPPAAPRPAPGPPPTPEQKTAFDRMFEEALNPSRSSTSAPRGESEPAGLHTTELVTQLHHLKLASS